VHQLYPIRTCTRQIAADGRHRGKSSACLRFHIGRCLGPCQGGVSSEAYHRVIADILEFLGGGQDAMLARVEREMFGAAERLDFERSARLRDALRQARQLMLSQQLLAGAVERNNLVFVCPAIEPQGAELFGIRHGRLFEQCSLADIEDAGAAQQIEDLLARLRSAAEAPPVIGQEEIDAIIIIGRWLERYGDSPQVVTLPAEPSSETVELIVAAIRKVQAMPVEEEEACPDWEEAL